jgi:hypothetical protein
MEEMARLEEASSNEILKTLENWEACLRHTSLAQEVERTPVQQRAPEP